MKMKQSRAYRFWKWLRAYATEKLAEADTGGGDRCPNCKLWHYERPEDHWHCIEVLPEKFFVDVLHCGQCEHKSYWRHDLLPFGLGMETDVTGKPLEKEKDVA